MSDRCEHCGRKAPTYQGHANYETWAVKLWIDNDQGLYEYWREQTREAWTEANDTEPLYESQTQSDHARITLANTLKDQLDSHANEYFGGPLPSVGMYADLLNAALSEVDWYEIADSMLEDEKLAGYEARA